MDTVNELLKDLTAEQISKLQKEAEAMREKNKKAPIKCLKGVLNNYWFDGTWKFQPEETMAVRHPEDKIDRRDSPVRVIPEAELEKFAQYVKTQIIKLSDWGYSGPSPEQLIKEYFGE